MKTENSLPVKIDEARVSKHNLTISRLNIIKQYSTSLTVNGVKDHTGLKKVVKTRKFIKGLRLNVEGRRKNINADPLREVRENNFAARFIINELKPSEKYLKAIEKEIANAKEEIRLEKKRLALERLQKRIDALTPYNVAVDIASIKDLTDEEFNTLLVKVQLGHAAEQARKKAEAKLLADENERLKQENLQLKQSVTVSDPSPEVTPVIDESNATSHVSPAPEQKAVATPDEVSDTKLIVKNYALALQAVPWPSIKNEQARAVFLSAHSHIQMGINMLLKAVE